MSQYKATPALERAICALAPPHKVFKKRTYNATYYFPTYDDAKEYAQTYGFPDDRIISYERGHAIQLRVSGPYVGPGSIPQARKKNLQSNFTKQQ